MSEIDNWIEIAQQCKYLPENDLKKLCDIVSNILLEESNVQPVSTPVTVCGDIHGQVTVYNNNYDEICLIYINFSFMIWKNYFVEEGKCLIQIMYFWVIL